MTKNTFNLIWEASDEEAIMTLTANYSVTDYTPTLLGYGLGFHNAKRINCRQDTLWLEDDDIARLNDICRDIIFAEGKPGKYGIIYENYIECHCASLCNVVFFRVYEDGDIVVSRYYQKKDKLPTNITLKRIDIERLYLETKDRIVKNEEV